MKQIACAIILKTDFDKKLQNISIIDSISKLVVFPYFYIRYQKPTLIRVQKPRLKSVGLCIQNVFKLSSFLELKNWIDYHLSIGFGEIRFYDAITNKTLTKFIQENYKNKKSIIIKYCSFYENYLRKKIYYNELIIL